MKHYQALKLGPLARVVATIPTRFVGTLRCGILAGLLVGF